MTPDPIEAKPTKEQAAFASEVALLMNKAATIGLYRTMHSLHEAVRTVGYELADIKSGEQKT